MPARDALCLTGRRVLAIELAEQSPTALQVSDPFDLDAAQREPGRRRPLGYVRSWVAKGFSCGSRRMAIPCVSSAWSGRTTLSRTQSFSRKTS